jgi:uncharacterized membrane protein
MYNLFKFLHIVSTMVWIGGVFTLIFINARLASSREGAVMRAMGQQSAVFGQVVLGPAAGLTLIAGIVTAILGGIRFDTLWILWGFAGVLGSALVGGVLIRRTAEELNRRAAGGSPDPSGLRALQSRLATLNLVNLLLLLSTVAAMVFKPTL